MAEVVDSIVVILARKVTRQTVPVSEQKDERRG